MKLLMVAYGLLATAAAAAPAGSTEGSAQTLLAQMKVACGGSAWDRVQSWHETGRVELAGGRAIENEVWHDMHSLKSAMVGRINGKIVRRAGFDGDTYWQVGPDGQVRTGTDPTGLRRQRRDAYLSSFGWFFPERFSADIRLGTASSVNSPKLAVLHITPRDAESFDLWIDRDTHLVRRIVAGSEYAELSEYKTFDGVCTATLGRQGNGDPKNEVTLHVVTVATTVPAPSTVFAPPPVPKP